MRTLIISSDSSKAHEYKKAIGYSNANIIQPMNAISLMNHYVDKKFNIVCIISADEENPEYKAFNEQLRKYNIKLFPENCNKLNIINCKADMNNSLKELHLI